MKSNISELRGIVGTSNDVIFIKGHTDPGDGGGGYFIWKDNIPNDPKYNDNDGAIIKAVNSNTGRWIRLIDGYINVKYFGTQGNFQPTDGDKIQIAIDFAANNVINNSITKSGSVVYIPAGNYKINNTLKLKNGVSILGEGFHSTVLTAGYLSPVDSSDLLPYNGFKSDHGNMIELDNGPIHGVNVSNLTLTGGIEPYGNTFNPAIVETRRKNCMHLRASVSNSAGDGGIWNSTFKNIRINHFNGCGIILEGGGGSNYNYNLPNQFLIFENVQIDRQKDETNCLLIMGQQGQITFINSRFDGLIYNKNQPFNPSQFKTNKKFNVVIQNKQDVQTAVVSFINCTFQNAEYGVYLRYAENITFDNCWFESLDRGVTAVKGDNPAKTPCKSINIINSRFANASGFGTLDVLNKNPDGSGRCITSEGCQVNVCNNFVAVTNVNTINPNNLFLLCIGINTGTNVFNNSFQHTMLGNTVFKKL